MDFKQPYNHQTFLHFLQHNFLPDDFEILEEDIDINFKTQFIKKAIFLGRVNSLGLNVYEAYHHSENDPRVSLSSEIFRLLADYGVRRALVIFISSKSSNYRFSLVTIDLKWEKGKQIKKEYSNPRRYSFYLGPDAKVHTPYQFLVNKGKIKNLDDLFLRFNVEVVTKEFFSKYRLLFEKLLNYLIKDNAFKIFAQKNNISIENFAKKLLGQIVFIYFLQRKGWLGARREDRINEGNKDFLRHLFDKSKLENKNFFNSYLEPLFYNALNSKSKYAANFYRDYFDCQIPFLNGGLFEPLNNYDWENEFIHLPDKLFSNDPKNPEKDGGILDIFDLYNFTVAEDDPVDKEVSIDPEMLGKVFENLLEENLRKGKGTYYTPREIVHYMCRESLINYLATEVNLIPEDVRNKYFPPYNVLGDKKFEARDVSVSEKIIESLKNIKVVDPACGSGAFLVGMLQQITQLRHELEMRSKLLGRRKIASTEYEIKKESIQNCIYGVDIDPGAVEIAKLRLWLSLVVDYELDQIEPLPNLDYKIMVGNSLIDKAIINDNIIEIFNPADLEEFKENKKFKNLFEEDLQGDIYSWNTKGEITTLVKQFTETKEQLFEESDFEKKLELKEKINQLENNIIRISLKKEFQNVKDRLKRYNLIPTERIHLEFTKNFLGDLMESNKELNKYKHENIFLWQLNFIEIFREKGGFDVVIANPPYVTTKYGKITHDMKKIYKKTFESAYDKIDLYVLFIEKSIKISKEHGFTTLITPWNFLGNFYSFKIRKFLLDNSKIKIFNKLPPNVFDSIIVDNIISIFEKDKNNQGNQILFDDLLNKNNQKYVDQDDYLQNENFLFNFPKDIVAVRILEKMKINSARLGTVALNYIGIMTGGQKKMIAHNSRFKNSKPVLSGKDIDKWIYFDRGNFVNFDKSKIHSNDNESVYLAKRKILLRKTGKRLTACLDEKQYYSIQSLYNIVVRDHDYTEEYLLALLNSSLYTYLYNKFFITNPEVFPYIKRRHLDQLPLKQASFIEQKSFITLVSKILNITKDEDYLEDEEKQKKVKEYELEIDQLVYNLYGLTSEETKIIEKGINS